MGRADDGYGFMQGITVPVIVAFRSEDDIGLLIVNTVINTVSLCDIEGNFFTTYFEENKDEVFNRRKIIFNYLKTSFLHFSCRKLCDYD
jgi:hypothetical protein